MKLLALRAKNFLSFKSIELVFPSSLTVLTGPNGVGKSNVSRCLDVAVSALETAASNTDLNFALASFESCGHNGSDNFEIQLDVHLDSDAEFDIMRLFVVSVSLGSLRSLGYADVTKYDDEISRKLVDDGIKPLLEGTLFVSYDARRRQGKWTIQWRFNYEQVKYRISVTSGQGDWLRAVLEVNQPKPIGGEKLSNYWIDEKKDEQPIVRDVLDFRDMLKVLRNGSHFDFAIDGLVGSHTPPSMAELTRRIGGNDGFPAARGFSALLASMIGSSLVLTDNRRLPLRRYFALGDLFGSVDLRDGSAVAAELYRLKQGAISERQKFERIRSSFLKLAGRELDVRASVVVRGEEESTHLLIEPVIIDGQSETPVEFSGAGVQEALLLSALIADPAGRLVVLDEPAINLEPTAQRRLLYQLRRGDQLIVITHSPDLVPVEGIDDLGCVARLSMNGGATRVHRPKSISEEQIARWTQLLQPTHVRSLLFAKGVILCEGSTEVGALPRWFRDAAEVMGRVSPEEANVAFVDVGGDNGFGAYVDFLEAYGIPWVIICDGPALRSGSKMHKQLSVGRDELLADIHRDDFVEWKKLWHDFGVMTFAENFGDDQTKVGEFEFYLQSVSPVKFEESRRMFPKSKVRAGSHFAQSEACPPVARSIYEKILVLLGV